MTLIELMIVVAIIAIIVSVAVPMFMKTTRRAKSSEVPAMFAEFKLRQQQYYTENGAYLSTGADESEKHPATPAGPDTPVSIAPVPATWTSLRMQPDKTSLYCSYVSIAGDADDSANIGAAATGFQFTTAPQVDWYYVLAECDFDGKTAVNSTYFTSSEQDGISSQNQGR